MAMNEFGPFDDDRLEDVSDEEQLLRQLLVRAIESRYIAPEDMDYLGDTYEDILATMRIIIAEHGDDPEQVLTEWGIVVAPRGESE